MGVFVHLRETGAARMDIVPVQLRTVTPVGLILNAVCDFRHGHDVICQKRLKRLLAETALMDTAWDHGPASRR